MFLYYIDILSPQITLYHRGLLYHSSYLSGIMSILFCIIVIVFSALYLRRLWERERDEPKMLTYVSFIEDAGEYVINSSSFFHFLSINTNMHSSKDEGFDFTLFRVIGTNRYLDVNGTDRNISQIDHWLYGQCNNDTDTQGISHLIYQDYFNKSACIKKYFNSKKGRYYNTNEEGFIWPVIAHGNFNHNSQFYNVIIEKCHQDSLNEIFNKGYKCKNDNEIDEIFKYVIIHFNFIDEYVDLQDYTNPIKKYFYTIENKIEKEIYAFNHLNFNPTLLRTNDGILTYKTKEEISYSFNRNELYSLYNNNNGYYMIYYFWLINRLNYCERSYNRLQDLISDIGGTYEVTISVFIIINKIFNYYAILCDTEKLLDLCPCTIKEIMKNERMKIKKFKQKKNKNLKDLDPKQKQKEILSKENNNFFAKSNEQELDKKDDNKMQSSSKNINNCTFIIEDEFKYENSEIINNKDSKKNFKSNNTINYKDKIKFWKYLLYKITFGKKNKKIKLFENFRTNIISVENIINNYLSISYISKVLNLDQFE